MDHQLDVIGEFEPDNFEKLAGGIRTNAKHLRWVGVGLKADDRLHMIDCMPNGCLVKPCLNADR